MMERKSYYTLFIGTLSIIGFLVFSPHLAYAQEGETAPPESRPTILPDSPFYGIKLAIENLRETFTLQDERRAELILKHAEERDREASELERQNKMIPLERLKAIQAEKLRKAEELILRLENIQSLKDQKQKELEERRELAQAKTDDERVMIQIKQKERESNLIEPEIGSFKIIEPETRRVAEKPIMILPVEDIDEDDDEREILTKLRDRLENSFSGTEITQIRAEFAELREEDDPETKILLAQQLDEKVNNPLVSISCFGRVNTLSLSLATDPVKELQEQCPILRTFDTEDVRNVVNGG